MFIPHDHDTEANVTQLPYRKLGASQGWIQKFTEPFLRPITLKAIIHRWLQKVGANMHRALIAHSHL